MARPRKPTEVLELNGAFDRNPQRRRPAAPKSPHAIGSPPGYFRADEKICWAEIVSNSVPGVLTAADRWIVETACLLMAKLRRREEMRGADYSTLMQAISKAGMTPVDRTRLTAPEPEKPASPYAEFLN